LPSAGLAGGWDGAESPTGGIVEPDVPGVFASASQVFDSILTDVTRSVGPAAMDPGAALALPGAPDALLCSVPVTSTR
jgi:hypothetical protein